MSSITSDQKRLLFDYSMGITSQQESDEVEQLIKTNPYAERLLESLQANLAPLNHLEQEENCPDHLVESTVNRLNNVARSTQLELEQLIDDEQKQTAKATRSRGFWRNFGELITAAAVILFAAGVLFPSLKFARQSSWQQQCQMQISRIFAGMNQYQADNDGALPHVAQAAGQPWWKVGYQGNENHSNTRHVWLLVKQGYVDATNFVCPGRSDGQALQFDPDKAHNFNDFPARRYITYSFRIACPDTQRLNAEEGKVLLSDLNPIFEELPEDYSRDLRKKLTEALIDLNSSNHNFKGQNVLTGDGSVKFAEQRQVGASKDDIFTLQNIKIYHGSEFPTCESDAFLAP